MNVEINLPSVKPTQNKEICLFIDAIKRCRLMSIDEFRSIRGVLCYLFLSNSITFLDPNDFIRRIIYGRHETIPTEEYEGLKRLRQNRDKIMWHYFGSTSMAKQPKELEPKVRMEPSNDGRLDASPPVKVVTHTLLDAKSKSVSMGERNDSEIKSKRERKPPKSVPPWQSVASTTNTDALTDIGTATLLCGQSKTNAAVIASTEKPPDKLDMKGISSKLTISNDGPDGVSFYVTDKKTQSKLEAAVLKANKQQTSSKSIQTETPEANRDDSSKPLVNTKNADEYKKFFSLLAHIAEEQEGRFMAPPGCSEWISSARKAFLDIAKSRAMREQVKLDDDQEWRPSAAVEADSMRSRSSRNRRSNKK